MAEGGVSPDSESDTISDEMDVEPINSLQLLFARDLVAHVMKRQTPNWTFGGCYAQKCPLTSLSYRVRRAVDFYLNKECLKLDILFHMAFKDEKMDYAGFVSVMELFVGDVFPMVHTSNDMLRFLSQFAYFTAKASKGGVHMAPCYAMYCLSDLIEVHLERNDIITEDFFGDLGFHAVNLMHENGLKIVIPPFV